MEYTDIAKGLKEGWLKEISLEKAKQFMYGNKEYIQKIIRLSELNLIRFFWSTKHHDLILCSVNKLKKGQGEKQ